jgi:hypothetical protein
MSTKRRMRSQTLALPLLLLATTACGTTVQTTGAAVPGAVSAPGAVGADGLSLSSGGTARTSTTDGLTLGTGAAGGAVGSVSLDGAPGATAAAPGAVAGPAGISGAAGPAAQGAPAAVRSGPGVTGTTLSVGFPYAPNADQAQEALGNTSVTQGDPKAVVEALARELNRTGGVGGRKLVVEFYELDASSSETAAQISQRICSYYTEDKKVFAVIGTSDQLLRDCLAKRGVLNIGGSIADLNENDFRISPSYYDASAVTLDRLARNLVDQLVAQKYFTPWDSSAGAPGAGQPVKVGIVVPDKPSWVPVIRNVLLPELKRAGYPIDPDAVRFWHFPESAAGNSQAVTEIQAIVLRFRSDGITHVLPMEQNSLAFFAPAAEGQGYRPRYGLSSAAGSQAFAGSLVPYRQLVGSVGVGWLPSIDLPESKQTPVYDGPGRKRCLETLDRGDVSYGSTNAKTIALLLCDAFFSFDGAIESLGRGAAVDVRSFMPALERLGARFAIATLPTGGFGPGKRYPVTDGFPYAYSPSCECMEYTGRRFALR